MLEPVIHDGDEALTAARALEYYIMYIAFERRDTPERQDEIDRAALILKRINKINDSFGHLHRG